MEGAKILDKLLEYTGLNGKSFSEKIGLARPQAIYDIQSGKTQNISANMANKIISAFPEVNRSWLMTGEGQMLKPAKNRFSQITEEEIAEITEKIFSEELAKAYERGDIYPAAVYNKAISEKDKRIEELQRQIWELQKKLEEK